jgi:hypothetical protein
MSETSRAYDFVYRGQLTEEALDRAGRISARRSDVDHHEIAELLSIDALDERHVEEARAMATVYTAIASFENSVRELIKKTLLDEFKEDWWNKGASKRIIEKAQRLIDDEENVRWHAQRGDDPIQYTMLPDLLSIIRQNFEHFEPFVHNIDWATSIFEIVERSRNTIMHSGTLNRRDIARLGSTIRDWTSQVAT